MGKAGGKQMKQVEGSFRDPDGYMFEYKGEFYRAVKTSYQPTYDYFLSSGLYQRLVDRRMLLPFQEVDQSQFVIPGLYKVLRPERIRYISYPYEWAFNMLKDAALLTLEIQKLSLESGMSLKDSSAFNVQFQYGKPIFIDTLSFELYTEGRPWVAYGQFCKHFLAPIALMARVDPGLCKMFIIHIDGIPLDLTAKMLPFWSRFNFGLYMHIFLHAKLQRKHEGDRVPILRNKRKFSLGSMKALLEGLKLLVENQNFRETKRGWSDYTAEHIHSQEYTEFKTKVISDFLEMAKPKTVWDIGANTGYYSRVAAQKNIEVISFDADPICVNMNYEMVRKNNETNILPLLQDLLNVSPSIGWGGVERLSSFNRNRPDLIVALAIIHHIAIGSNIQFESIAYHFASLANDLIIEFVPKEDEKAKLLLLNREDIFTDYNLFKFETVFSKYYRIERKILSLYNSRVFYLMTKHGKPV